MSILSSIQNNLSGNFYKDQNERQVNNQNFNDDNDLLLDPAAMQERKDKTAKLLSNNEKSTLHMFFGTQMPDDMKLYGHNDIKQINKGQLLDLRG
ncbi:MAG: hypothetical protein ACLFQM_05895 [Fidelibacterota bacterium]